MPPRGRAAHVPTEIPAAGWLDVLARAKQQLTEDNLSITAAGVAFYTFVAAVPALAATVSIYALVANPATVADHVQRLSHVLPAEVMPLVQEQVSRIASNTQAAGWGAGLGIAMALFSSASATRALIAGLNIAYDEEEKRNFLQLLLQSIGLTLVAIVGVLLVIGLLAITPIALRAAGVSAHTEAFLGWLRWPCLLLLFLGGLSGLYRYGPSRRPPRWSWLSAGAGAATALWAVASAAFSLYVSRFGSYDKVYGSLGAVVVFLFWLYLTAYVVLLGAELNSEMERQTERDTTTGPDQPRGKRGAFAADTVGPSRD